MEIMAEEKPKKLRRGRVPADEKIKAIDVLIHNKREEVKQLQERRNRVVADQENKIARLQAEISKATGPRQATE